MAAPAYRDGGLIVVTFDEGSEAAACCGESSGLGPSHPNVPLPGKTGPGGGRIGAVLLSPLVRPGTVSTVQYFSPYDDGVLGDRASAITRASAASRAAASASSTA